MSKNNFALILIPVLPGQTSGYQIAVKSALELYAEVFNYINVVAIIPERIKDNPNTLGSFLKKNNHADFELYTLAQRKKWIRFLKSLPKSTPAVAVQFAIRTGHRYISNTLKKLKSNGDMTIIFEDIPLSYYLPKVKKILPGSKTIIRSHNVLGEAFSGFENQNKVFGDFAWKIENVKIKKFEKKVLEAADFTFSISSRDAEQYKKLYGIKMDGIISVGIDTAKYDQVVRGDINNIISLGSADLRKAHGITQFIQKAWPEIAARNNGCYLLLGGKNTEKLVNPLLRIKGFGFVDNQYGFLGKGQIFLNPQQLGSGVKLKSITAMLAGKTLVSTPKGVEGVKGKNGRDFLVAKNDEDFVRIIDELIKNPARASAIAQNGKEVAIQNYNTQTFLSNNISSFKHTIGL